MSRSKFAVLLDNIFYCTALIFVVTMFIGEFTNKLQTQFVLGTVLGVLFYIYLNKILKSRVKLHQLKKNELKHKDEVVKTLSALPKQKVEQFFKKMLEQKFKVTHNLNLLTVLSNSSSNPLYNVYTNFYLPELNIEHFYTILNQHNSFNNLPLLIFANNFSADVLHISSTFENVILLNETETYKFLKEFNCFPKITTPQNKPSIKDSIIKSLSKVNTKKFFGVSIFFAIFSFFTFYKTYYIVSSLIFFIFSLICYFSKQVIIKPTLIGYQKYQELFSNTEQKN